MKNNRKKNLSIAEHVIYEFFGKGNLSMYEQLVAKDVKIHCPKSWQELHPIELNTRESAKLIDRQYAQAFLINKVEIEDCIHSQNKIIVRWSCEANHRGNFFKYNATYRPIQLTGQTTYSFTDEMQIGEVWQAWDMLGLLKQIGSEIPPLAQFESKEIGKLLKRGALLSERERECMKYLLQGKTAKETANSMKLSHRTVEYYFENIKDKLDCFNKRSLFACAHQLEQHHLL